MASASDVRGESSWWAVYLGRPKAGVYWRKVCPTRSRRYSAYQGLVRIWLCICRRYGCSILTAINHPWYLTHASLVAWALNPRRPAAGTAIKRPWVHWIRAVVWPPPPLTVPHAAQRGRVRSGDGRQLLVTTSQAPGFAANWQHGLSVRSDQCRVSRYWSEVVTRTQRWRL